MVGINPTSPTAPEAACTKLTQDEKVFVAVGFFLADNVLCYVNTNPTATIGGAIPPARLAQAKAPWYSTDAGENLEINVVKALAKAGKLDGKLGGAGRRRRPAAAERQDQAGADRGGHQARADGDHGRPDQRRHRHLRPGPDDLRAVQGRRRREGAAGRRVGPGRLPARAWPRPLTGRS